MPIGGWVGIIEEMQGNGIYCVRWSNETLAAIHPVFKNRCERDCLEFEIYGINAEDIELDDGSPILIDQPKKIITNPLDLKKQDDRIKLALGLTSNHPILEVSNETLTIYHKYLSENLSFPFKAEHGKEYGHPERVKVVCLGDPGDEVMIDDSYGILCDVRIEREVVTVPLGELDDVKGKLNKQLVKDYSYWFWNWR